MPMQLPIDPEAARVVSFIMNSGLPLRARKGILAALARSRRDSYRIGHDPKVDAHLTEARLAALTEATSWHSRTAGRCRPARRWPG